MSDIKEETSVKTQNTARGVGAAAGRANWLLESVVVLLCVLWLIPTVGLLITSIRYPDDANHTGWWTWFASPLQSTMENYSAVLTNDTNPMGPAFINSLTVTVPATVIPILLAAFAAYAFTFMRFPGRDFLFIIVVGLLVIPNQVALVPLSILFNSWGINGQFLAIWLVHAGFGMPLAVYILRNYMATLPRSVIESAKIDGASHFQAFWRLVVPMSVPALASFAIFQFLWVWNDLLLATVFIGPGANQPMTVALRGMLGDRGQNWQLLTAGAFLTMLLPLVVFFGLQRYFVRGLTAGAVKG